MPLHTSPNFKLGMSHYRKELCGALSHVLCANPSPWLTAGFLVCYSRLACVWTSLITQVMFFLSLSNASVLNFSNMHVAQLMNRGSASNRTTSPMTQLLHMPREEIKITFMRCNQYKGCLFAVRKHRYLRFNIWFDNAQIKSPYALSLLLDFVFMATRAICLCLPQSAFSICILCTTW